MKKHHFLLFIILTSLFFIACSDNNLLLDSEVKNTCDCEGEPIMELHGLNTKLFHIYDPTPMGYLISNPGIYYRENNPNPLLKINTNTEESILCIICNFPDEAKKLKVTNQGLDIVLSGKVYESTDSTYKYLKLTKLKKK